MGETNHQAVARLSKGVSKARNTFYAMFMCNLWLGFGLCLGLEFVELTLGQEDSVNILL
jgi:hypothetical protein